MSFRTDKEFSDKFNDRFEHYIRQYFKRDALKVDRLEFGNEINELLDKKLHIDLLVDDNGIKYSIQKKVLRHECLKFGTFTIEYLQNRHTGEQGEFYHILAQYYLHGYSNEAEDDFEELYVVQVAPFKKWATNEGLCQVRYRDDNNSQASFMYIKYKDVPAGLIERVK